MEFMFSTVGLGEISVRPKVLSSLADACCEKQNFRSLHFALVPTTTCKMIVLRASCTFWFWGVSCIPIHAYHQVYRLRN